MRLAAAFLAFLLFPSAIHAQCNTGTLTDQLLCELEKADAAGKGEAYELTKGNTLPGGPARQYPNGDQWLLQSPNWWGKPAILLPVASCPKCSAADGNLQFDMNYCKTTCLVGTCEFMSATLGDRKVCVGHSDLMVNQFFYGISDGGKLIDIATLNMPTGRFLAAVQNALAGLARGTEPKTVRILIGSVVGGGTPSNMLAELMAKTPRQKSGLRVQLAIGAFGTAHRHWNHSKIVSTGTHAIVGGHNLWHDDYLLYEPVHDVTMQLDGPAAASAQKFLGRIWSTACSSATVPRFRYDGSNATMSAGCFAGVPAISVQKGAGTTTVLAVGNYASGVVSSPRRGDLADLARDEAFRRAKKSIKLSQQDIGFAIHYPGSTDKVNWPERTVRELVEAALRSVPVYIVLSSRGAAVGSGSTPYASPVSMNLLATKFMEVGRAMKNPLERKDLATRFCQYVHMAELRFSKDDEWKAKRKPANHAKVWIVDDQAFFIGSDNIYPAELQEFGYIVDGASETTKFNDLYWNKLWQWSSRTAVSGREGACVFDEWKR